MPSLLRILALALLAALPSAQVPASAVVRRGCTIQAPPESLLPSLVEPQVFLPDARGVVDMETESVGPRGSWIVEDTLPGFRGSGYLRWVGPDLFQKPGVDVLTFRFRVAASDRFLIRLRNRHDHLDTSSENDCWFRLDGGPWIKLVDNWGPSGIGVWSFNAFLETTAAFPEYDLAAGVHVVELSGRSRNFKIDSLHVLPKSVWFASETSPESPLERQRPRIGLPFSFEVGDPTATSGLAPGSTLALPFLSHPGANAPCGTPLPSGELLIDPAGASLPFTALPWAGPTTPARFTTTIPYQPAWLGQTFSLQAVLWQPGRTVLTDALDLTLGDS